MRVLSFQKAEVVRIIIEEGIYKSDPSKSREKRDYIKDIEQLNGENPIWCFTPEREHKFTLTDFKDGVLLETYRCEMSKNNLGGLILLELEVPEEELKVGLTHNAYNLAKVFPVITKDMLCAVYKITALKHWFYVDVHLVFKFKEDILFPNGLECKKFHKGEWKRVEEGSYLVNFKILPKVDVFGKETSVIECGIDYEVTSAILNSVPHGTVSVLGKDKKRYWFNPTKDDIKMETIRIEPNAYLYDYDDGEFEKLDCIVSKYKENFNLLFTESIISTDIEGL